MQQKRDGADRRNRSSSPLLGRIATGDDRADSGMIKTAGLGVAIGNGGSGLKAAADFAALSNDGGGVAHNH